MNNLIESVYIRNKENTLFPLQLRLKQPAASALALRLDSCVADNALQIFLQLVSHFIADPIAGRYSK